MYEMILLKAESFFWKTEAILVRYIYHTGVSKR